MARKAVTTSTWATSHARRLQPSTASTGGVLNIGTGVATSVLELYEACRSVAESDAEPVYEAERPGELGRSVLDTELAAATLGFRAETPLAAGVAETWEWMQGQ